jgi:hypothetical protein
MALHARVGDPPGAQLAAHRADAVPHGIGLRHNLNGEHASSGSSTICKRRRRPALRGYRVGEASAWGGNVSEQGHRLPWRHTLRLSGPGEGGFQSLTSKE